MTDDRERWALILGGSSGMGEATALALAKAGYNICGIHLDFRAALAHVEEVKAAIEAEGVQALYINMNAADDEKRAAALATLRERFDASEAAGRHPYVRVVMHSLAFGSLVPYISDDPKGAVDRKKMEMTQDVMANSLVYWVQDLYRGGFLENGSKIYAMTSEGSSRVVPSYGVVSSAKAALESHIRQLAMELAQTRKGITANTIRAGVTMTPALMKIPEHDMIIASATKRNPTGRMTTPQDVAKAIVVAVRRGHRLHQRRGDRRRRRRVHHGVLSVAGGRVIVVGSVNVDLVVTTERLPAPGRDRHRRPVRAAPRRQGRQPGGGRRPARGDGPSSSARSGTTRSGGRHGRRSRPRGSTSPGLLTLPDEATGVALIVVDEAGENSHRRRRRRERGARLGPGAGRAQAPRTQAGGRRARRSRDPDRRDPRGAPARPHRRATTILNPAPAHGLERSDARAGGHPDARTRASWRRSPAGDGRPSAQAKRLLGPEPGDRAVLVSLGANGTLLVDGKRSRGDRRPRRSRSSTRSGPATRSTGRWRRDWRPASTSSRRSRRAGDRRLARGHAARAREGDADRRRARSRPGLAAAPRGQSIAPAQIEKT